MAIQISRRGLIGGFASLLAAPAIVRASSLMPVKALATPSKAVVWTPSNGFVVGDLIRFVNGRPMKMGGTIDATVLGVVTRGGDEPLICTSVWPAKPIRMSDYR